MDSEIVVENLRKVYKVPVRNHGLISSLKSLIHPIYNNVVAVDGISFKIKKSEIIGFLGPNGAGKTTTLKMLAGLLYPTSGSVEVFGFKPYERKSEYLKKISMITGNKSQLNQSITVLDSLYLTKEIYGIEDKVYKKRLDELVELLNISELLLRLPRNLSLGERAKCEFAVALLYKPEIIYLDEPTLGMDISVQIKLREFIKTYNKENNITVILTSHYMGDITSLCSRVILIDKGKLMYDGGLMELSNKLLPFKLIKITFHDKPAGFKKVKSLLKCETTLINEIEQSIALRIKKEDVSRATVELLNNFSLADLTIEDPSIEAVFDQVYREGVSV
ncbi:ABC transporter ATP-binding protein [Acetivibrio mesophilus]|uniref:ATP-binding cassette domain-containing protein n=1 Tax=Acetivibrio mesophilus TaxID=2487273 RepID=A0A4Q0I8B2_9FIRM|nr:ATP-binding cassette domain-containing protein [Acetivibrio mesophilus]ODM26251.1 hypothetical protein A7W90_08440 [Clostridium sp. Bc-iso-3]RXE60696.1 ATP-binding cassette domain-containing protein [Acetivibrio mesophilus]HHV28109.1 ATP-binding cassette domain-containing protein [Clostridium sp.]